MSVSSSLYRSITRSAKQASQAPSLVRRASPAAVPARARRARY